MQYKCMDFRLEAAAQEDSDSHHVRLQHAARIEMHPHPLDTSTIL